MFFYFIMELTGKCKQDFLDHLNNTNQSYLEKGVLKLHWQEYPKKYLNALIIEFFDSVGIYIETWHYDGFCWQIDCDLLDESPKYNEPLKSRSEAQTEAIKKANQIYNEL